MTTVEEATRLKVAELGSVEAFQQYLKDEPDAWIEFLAKVNETQRVVLVAKGYQSLNLVRAGQCPSCADVVYFRVGMKKGTRTKCKCDDREWEFNGSQSMRIVDLTLEPSAWSQEMVEEFIG